MSNNNSCQQQPFTPIRNSVSTPALNSLTTVMPMVDKSTQVNLDCDPGEDPKMGKKYWQDIAGLRGARLEYMTYDFRELSGQYQQLTASVSFLSLKLAMAQKEIADLKAKRCRCQRQQYYPPRRYDSLGL